MENFTPVTAAIGGILVGLSAALIYAFNGKIAGVSGILGGLIGDKEQGDRLWRVLFAVGMLAGGAIVLAFLPERINVRFDAGLVTMAIAGFLVGYGTRLGNGCTSGHGVCGLARFSFRSFVAVLVFMGCGGVTVFLVKHVF